MHKERAERIKKSIDVGWDDLREQRILGEVLEARQTKRMRGGGVPRARVTLAAGGVLLVASVAAAVTLLLRPAPAPTASTNTAPATSASGAPQPHATMTLADGSQLVLERDTKIEVREQTAEVVTVEQKPGRVTYDVQHAPARRFTIEVADVRVRVRGTKFTVELAGEWVDVRVERGRVAVEDGEHATETELAAGEAIHVRARRATPAPATDDVVPQAAPTASVIATGSRAGSGPRSAAQVETVDALLADADRARSEGHLDEAASTLHKLITTHGRDPRVASATFTLGRVESARGRYVASAEAFARCRRLARGSLAEDALAEEATSWKSAGDATRARAAAKLYVQRYPRGVHDKRMRDLLSSEAP